MHPAPDKHFDLRAFAIFALGNFDFLTAPRLKRAVNLHDRATESGVNVQNLQATA
jgi:hypothetical protein